MFFEKTGKKRKGKRRQGISRDFKEQLKLKLQQKYALEWKEDIVSSSKLNFYGEIKKYTFEKTY